MFIYLYIISNFIFITHTYIFAYISSISSYLMLTFSVLYAFVLDLDDTNMLRLMLTCDSSEVRWCVQAATVVSPRESLVMRG